MAGYAVLIGDSPENLRQKKLEEMYDFLQTREGGFFKPKEILEFPHGISELTLEGILDNIIEEKPKKVFLYFVTKAPVRDSETSVWAGGEEIRKDVIAGYQKLAGETGSGFQVIFDVCSEFISEDELGYEELEESETLNLAEWCKEDDSRNGLGCDGNINRNRKTENGWESFF